MIAAKVVPTLSPHGWVHGTAEKVDFLLAHFFETEANQSYIFYGSVTSIQALIEQAMHDMFQLCKLIKDRLGDFLKRYFDAVVIECSEQEATPGSNRTDIRLFVQVIDDGKEYSVGQLLREKNSKFTRVVNLNNTGDPERSE